jgi:hypothetical protein
MTSPPACRFVTRTPPWCPSLADRQVEPARHIDAMIALAMAVERAEQKPAPVELLGWL